MRVELVSEWNGNRVNHRLLLSCRVETVRVWDVVSDRANNVSPCTGEIQNLQCGQVIGNVKSIIIWFISLDHLSTEQSPKEEDVLTISAAPDWHSNHTSYPHIVGPRNLGKLSLFLGCIGQGR